MVDLTGNKALASQVSNVAARLENDGDEWGVVALLREAAAALSAGAEPVEYQFQDADGRWCGFHSDKHRDDTIADGRWPIRALYTRPQPATPASGWMPIESAPKDGTLVILGAVGHESVSARWGWESPWIDGWWCDGHRSDAEGPRFTPTHWQPLPAPPASTETDKQTAAEQAALERV